MKTFRMAGPSGPVETVAPNLRKAWANIRYRLIREYGMSWYAASRYDHSDLKEVVR